MQLDHLEGCLRVRIEMPGLVFSNIVGFPGLCESPLPACHRLSPNDLVHFLLLRCDSLLSLQVRIQLVHLALKSTEGTLRPVLEHGSSVGVSESRLLRHGIFRWLWLLLLFKIVAALLGSLAQQLPCLRLLALVLAPVIVG